MAFEAPQTLLGATDLPLFKECTSSMGLLGWEAHPLLISVEDVEGDLLWGFQDL